MEFDRDFGINQVFVDDQYERWRDNPQTVDEAWQRYFAQLAGIPLPQARPQALQTSGFSQPPQAAPSTGNGHGNGQGNGHGQIAVRPAAPEGQFAAALLDLADHSPEAQRLAAEE